MSRQGKILERAMLGMNLYGEALPGLPLVEIVGKRRVLVENHCGINCYTDSEIHINSRIGIIRVGGEELLIAKVTKEFLVITGIINTVTINN